VHNQAIRDNEQLFLTMDLKQEVGPTEED